MKGRIANVLRISADKKVEHESDKKKQKLGHVPTTIIADPYPSPEVQREYLSQCYFQHYDANNLEPFEKSVRRTLKDVATEYHFHPDQTTIFELAPKVILHTCLSTTRPDGCELFTILQRATHRQLCFFCSELERRCDRREKKIEITAESRLQASSTVTFSSMSPPDMISRMRYMSGKIRSQNRTIRRYKLMQSSKQKEL